MTLASDPATSRSTWSQPTTASPSAPASSRRRHHGARRGPIFTIGRPPHGLFTVHDTRLELILLDRPVPAALAELIGGPPVTVPESDLDDLDEVHPGWATATVGSSDGSITVDRH